MRQDFDMTTAGPAGHERATVEDAARLMGLSVAAGLATKCEVQVAYAIGKAEPVGLFVDTFGTGVVDDEALQAAITEVFDLRPAAIIRDLDLLRPIYGQTSAYGHFGREGFTWESTDRAELLKKAAGQ